MRLSHPRLPRLGEMRVASREARVASARRSGVFVVVRAVRAIPAVARMGEVGLVSTVWTVIALAGFVPSVVIAWQTTFPRKAATQAAR